VKRKLFSFYQKNTGSERENGEKTLFPQGVSLLVTAKKFSVVFLSDAII
jgi:hypothetical protein